jgi:hypothetical protein
VTHGTITILEPVINLINSGNPNKLLPAGIGFVGISGKPVNFIRIAKMPAARGTINLSGTPAALIKEPSEEVLAGIKVWTGSAWVEKPIKVWTGSVWTQKPTKVWNGSAWT